MLNYADFDIVAETDSDSMYSHLASVNTVHSNHCEVVYCDVEIAQCERAMPIKQTCIIVRQLEVRCSLGAHLW